MESSTPPAGTAAVTVTTVQDGRISRAADLLATEVPVALHCNGSPFVVMMATPHQLDDFAHGFSVSEGLVDSIDEITACAVRPIEPGRPLADFEIALQIPPARHAALLKRQRNLLGRSSCGLCGTATIEAAMHSPRPVTSSMTLPTGAIDRALAALAHHQPLNQLTGALHGAAWCTITGEITALHEDVGRHNALDKLIGQRLRARDDFAAGFALITSRASYEMVQKSASVGIAVLVAVSAPTLAAVELATACNITLVGFARGNRHLIYSHPQRLLASADSGRVAAR